MKISKALILATSLLFTAASTADIITISFDGTAYGRDDFGLFGTSYRDDYSHYPDDYYRQYYFMDDISVSMTYDTSKAPSASNDWGNSYIEEGNYDWLDVSFTFAGVLYDGMYTIPLSQVYCMKTLVLAEV
jgi:hypothetical protein